ncbi:MAG: TlpA family protein disulfide reductase [Bryobacterales bacterium]|nr:TlpA family protein disulfide reductase [Bryobacterales bacterium]
MGDGRRKGVLTLAGCLLLAPAAEAQALVRDVRSAIAKGDYTGAEAQIEKYRADRGVTAEMLEALSWLGRGALAAGRLEQAESYAVSTQEQALVLLKSRQMDADNSLPLAMGAAIEVQAQVLAARGERSAAVAFLQGELARYFGTSIRTRIQKNINLLTLEGKTAPPLETAQWLGPKPAAAGELKGKAVLLFFWAHWCGDCKWQAPVLARLKAEYGPRGLVIIGPTQYYGYTARGASAAPAEELKYIDEVRLKSYAGLEDMAVPVSQENFRNYGASTTPTLVLMDRRGTVRLYHPGQMAYEDLAKRVQEALD